MTGLLKHPTAAMRKRQEHQSPPSTQTTTAAAVSSSSCACGMTASTIPPLDNPNNTNSAILYCSACVRNSLQAVHERRQVALAEWKASKQECADYYSDQQQQPHVVVDDDHHHDGGGSGNSMVVLAELQDRSQQLRQQLEMLRKQCAELAVTTCAKQVELEERQQQQQGDPPQQQSAATTVAMQRDQLDRLTKSMILLHEEEEEVDNNGCRNNNSTTRTVVVGGALQQAIDSERHRVRALRFGWAVKAFEIHRLQVVEQQPPPQQQDPEQPSSSSSPTKKNRHQQRKFASGVGKINGLPLPHAGPELYGVLPTEELQSALRLVASLTSLAARCLGILLPHPILLRPPSSSSSSRRSSISTTTDTSRHRRRSMSDEEDDIAPASAMGRKTSTRGGAVRRDNKSATTSLTSSISSALHQAAHNGGFATSLPQPPPLLSMDPSKVSQRVQHAVAAVLAEDRSCSTFYNLSASSMTAKNSDEFAIALQLLQNDVIALCIRSGVPVANLWPGEAVLLNLQALYVYCESQAHIML